MGSLVYPPLPPLPAPATLCGIGISGLWAGDQQGPLASRRRAVMSGGR